MTCAARRVTYTSNATPMASVPVPPGKNLLHCPTIDTSNKTVALSHYVDQGRNFEARRIVVAGTYYMCTGACPALVLTHKASMRPDEICFDAGGR